MVDSWYVSFISVHRRVRIGIEDSTKDNGGIGCNGDPRMPYL